jgi:tRNA-specific 2-thiouridylase
MLSQEQMARTYFPLGEMPSKAAARTLARELGLSVADKPDSQEICFVSEAGGYREFLLNKRPDIFQKGELVDTSGKPLGEHEGVANFTVGQRRGIGLSGAKPLYVIALKPQENKVVLGDSDDLLTREVPLENMFWSGRQGTKPQHVMAKIRYNMQPQRATLYGTDEPRLVFDEPVRAVTPGQIAVAYKGQSVVAGGVIANQTTY